MQAYKSYTTYNEFKKNYTMRIADRNVLEEWRCQFSQIFRNSELCFGVS